MAIDATAAERQRRHRERLAVVDNTAAPRLSSLVLAVIGELPPSGEPFTRADRTAWLKMMATAFDVSYGVVEPVDIDLPAMREAVATASPAAAAEPPAPIRQAHAGHEFYVSRDGTVCNADGTPVLRDDVPADETVFDYRPVTGEFRDTTSIVWADGQRGTAGLAPGVSFCGPG